MMAKRRYNKASSRIAKRQKAKKYISLFLKISLPVVFVAGFVFLLRADFLQVKNFEVLGIETLQPEDVKNTAKNFTSGARFFLVPRSNIFLLNKDKLAAALLANFSRLEKVAVNKQFLSKSIKLSLTERKVDFLWCSMQDECFFMDKSGLIFEKAENIDNKIIFRGVLEENPLMRNLATLEKMQNYLRLIEVLRNAGLEISSINIESSDRAIAKTKIGDIIFHPEEADLSLAGENAILLINEIRNKNPSALFQYIDARFGNKIFYKLH